MRQYKSLIKRRVFEPMRAVVGCSAWRRRTAAQQQRLAPGLAAGACTGRMHLAPGCRYQMRMRCGRDR